MPVQPMYKRLNTRFIQMANITRRLPTLLTLNKVLRIYRSESVNDDFASDGLNRVNDNCDGSIVELFERLFESAFVSPHEILS